LAGRSKKNKQTINEIYKTEDGEMEETERPNAFVVGDMADPGSVRSFNLAGGLADFRLFIRSEITAEEYLRREEARGGGPRIRIEDFQSPRERGARQRMLEARKIGGWRGEFLEVWEGIKLLFNQALIDLGIRDAA